MNVQPAAATGAVTPFDQARLDALMEEAGIDVLLATSKHNVQYLLGGYRYIFFHAMEAIGHSRYLPVVVYQKGRPGNAAYVGNRMEGMEQQVNPFWTPKVRTTCWGTVDAAAEAIDHVKALGQAGARIGIEPPFLPSDAADALRSGLEGARFVDATSVLERLRAIKTPAELDRLRKASELITDSMQAVFAGHGEGASKAELVDALRREETERGLQFEYCLITVGASHNRAVSPQTWRKGEVLSLDSGGNYHGYIGDLCRMGVLGEPDSELRDLLEEVETVQQAAFSKIRAGATGADMIAHADGVLKSLPNAACNDFFAHGMGLISHEAPFLMTNHPVAYEGVDADRPLEANMVISVETTMLHPSRGFIKLEDTVAVTEDGFELIGDRGRGWNRGRD
ncbi:aminopeptidase P family protein [Nitratireductor mangrovi]|uniref:Aminopeptidase P family protein n=1 Tax=Nitratireductor mangrovi TaxID=2599600 RepID=A0A5B8L285_9HYPH|nr:Xaa-Pro peptidase family protein [Nitratireductor mangrovi]QDZ01810.1 aminopeptidase P family protein [Nitratireductor mangrovi]